jgi:hypothetical protein
MLGLSLLVISGYEPEGEKTPALSASSPNPELIVLIQACGSALGAVTMTGSVQAVAI